MNQQQNMDEILFKNRNKEYGAYTIRSEYSFTLLKSLFSTLTLALGLALICFVNSKKAIPSEIKPLLLPPQQNPVYTTPVDLSPKNSGLKKETLAPLSKKESEQTAIVIRDSLVFNKDTTQALAQETEQNNEKEGIIKQENSFHADDGKKESMGKGIRSDTAVALIADEYPEFEGGMAALNRWIASRLRYPEEAIYHTKQGKVHVKFVVDEQGRVQFPVAMNKLGYGLEEEALRVVSGIPKFKSPAKISGQPVKCYFVLPVNFKLY